MTPWQQAKLWLRRQKNSDGFEETLAEYIKEGLVYSDDKTFLLARECSVKDRAVIFDRKEKKNAWFVQLAAGQNQFARFLALAPRRRDFVVWQRHGHPDYHIWRWSRFKEKIGG